MNNLINIEHKYKIVWSDDKSLPHISATPEKYRNGTDKNQIASNRFGDYCYRLKIRVDEFILISEKKDLKTRWGANIDPYQSKETIERLNRACACNVTFFCTNCDHVFSKHIDVWNDYLKFDQLRHISDNKYKAYLKCSQCNTTNK